MQTFDLGKQIEQSAKNYGIDPVVYRALIYSEYNPSQWVNPASGSRGFSQMLPSTFADMGYQFNNINDPVQNLDAGAKYFEYLIRQNNGDIQGAVRQYKGIANPNKPANLAIMARFNKLLQNSKTAAAFGTGFSDVIELPSAEQIKKDEDFVDTARMVQSGLDIVERVKNPQFFIYFFIAVILFVFAIYSFNAPPVTVELL